MEKYVFFFLVLFFVSLFFFAQISCCLDKVFDRHFSLGILSLSEKEVLGWKDVSLSRVLRKKKKNAT